MKIHNRMKIIQNESYLVFIKRRIKAFFSKSTSLIYTSLVLLGIAIWWYEDGFLEMLKVLTMLLNAFTILLFLVELFSTIISKEIDKNNFISQLGAIFILTTISYIFYDENFRYWSFVLGLMLFVPIIINIFFAKIRLWFNL
jgi:hypothetical protein